MRARWWYAALALLAAVACAAARHAHTHTQSEGVTRTGRRLSTPSLAGSRGSTTSEKPEDVEHTSTRSRHARRREEAPPKEITRTRSRSRPSELVSSAVPERETESYAERNARFNPRRAYSRTRNRTNTEEIIIKEEKLPPQIHSSIRNRPRQSSKESTPTPAETSSPKIDESKIEVINSNLEDIPKMRFNDDTTSRTQFIRRSSSSIIQSPDIIPVKKVRNRINTNTRTENAKSEPDLTSSGTTNTVSITEKEPTTARNIGDARSFRKLRYKTRLSETETNLTGQGITASFNEVKSTSQKEKTFASHPDVQTYRPIAVPVSPRVQSFKPLPPIPVPVMTQSEKPDNQQKRMKVVRRPLTRGSTTFRPAASIPKTKPDEIDEDDNYPETFKALLQAKNASTHAGSQSSESLSVKESQTIYKTITPTGQSTDNNHTEKQQTTSRPRISPHDNEEEKEVATTPKINKQKVVEKKMYKRPEYKPRGSYSYSPRNAKQSINTVSTQDSSTETPGYKFTRKFKITTTEAPRSVSLKAKRLQAASNALKKPLVRPSYYSRRNSSRSYSSTTTESTSRVATSETKLTLKSTEKTTTGEFLPRTSYYSRNRNIKIDAKIHVTEAPENEKISLKNKKIEPLEDQMLYTSITGLGNHNTVEEKSLNKQNAGEIFVIAVTSKESQDKSTENDVDNITIDRENDQAFPSLSSTSKYHASYKDWNSISPVDDQEEIMITGAPLLHNIHSRKLIRPKYTENYSDPNAPTLSPDEASLKRFTETYAKATVSISNGITPEPEKSKGRFSSKYRAQYLDKPFYKPTIPSVTPSTAWLKFYVTDRELTKVIQDPIRFDGEQLYDVTTELPRLLNTENSSFTIEPSIELEGEESQLGQDMNAISYTQTRRTLSSADLRLSESVMKATHVMNVEASQHSPSVTVSIFDALADILTSTPRQKLSSTTDVPSKQTLNFDVKLDGVSNNINVHNVRGLASRDTFMSTVSDLATNTEFVQNTDKPSPINVINRITAGESATPSLNEKQNKTVNIPKNIPSPQSSTPNYIRRPFAVKVLYSDTDTPPDMTTSEPPSNLPSTDIPTMVQNSKSDILIFNNNLVSSELTSMLSNNIQDIIKHMDKESRSKISGNMANLLRNLIPRAIDGLANTPDDVEIIPETTPYSLEEIRDTEIIIDFHNNATNIFPKTDLLQNVTDPNIVNIEGDTKVTLAVIPSIFPAVNIPGSLLDVTFRTASESSSQTELVPTMVSFTESEISTTLRENSASITTEINSLDSDAVTVDDRGNRNIASDFTGTDVVASNLDKPIPFFTNAKVSDFTLGELGSLVDIETSTQLQPLPLSTLSQYSIQLKQPPEEILRLATFDPSTVSPVQLRILTKKARVLQMIEDLIREHNKELQTESPLVELLNQPSNLPLSNRLTEIINNMSPTTTSDVSTLSVISSSLMTTTSSPDPNIPSFISSLMSRSEELTTIMPDGGLNTFISMPEVTTTEGEEPTTNQPSQDNFTTKITSKMDKIITNTSPMSSLSLATTEKSSIGSADKLLISQENADNVESTTTENFDATPIAEKEDAIPQIIDILPTQLDTEITTQVNVETTTTIKPKEMSKFTTASENARTQVIPPKKDYVIFGILPNNTVVRKDPNDDILETLTEASPYIIYGVLPNNTIIRRFPNGTRVPRVMQKVDILPISPWSLRNPYSPIHNNPAFVRPQSYPIRVSTNVAQTSTDTSYNGTENQYTSDTVHTQQPMMYSPVLNVRESSMLGVVTTTNMLPAEKSTASHVLSLRTTTMLPSVDEILLNSISSAAKEEMVISSMTSSTREPTILTLDIDPETKQIRIETPGNENMNAIFKFIPINKVTVAPQKSNVFKLGTKSMPISMSTVKIEPNTPVTEANTQTPQFQMSIEMEPSVDPTTTVQVDVGTPLEANADNNLPVSSSESNTPMLTTTESTIFPPTTSAPVILTTIAPIETTITISTEAISTSPLTTSTERVTTNAFPTYSTVFPITNIEEDTESNKVDIKLLQDIQESTTVSRNPKNLNFVANNNAIPSQKSTTPANIIVSSKNYNQDTEQLLQALLAAAGQNPGIVNKPSLLRPNDLPQQKPTTVKPSSSTKSIEEDIKQFEEDAILLKALLEATGQNPANFNIPTLNSITTTPRTSLTTTITPFTTTRNIVISTPSIQQDIKQFQEDALLLQTLLQATGQKQANLNLPIISSEVSNVKMSNRPLTTPTTLPTRLVYTPEISTQSVTTNVPSTTSPMITTTFQPRTTDNNRWISTTYQMNERRRPIESTTRPYIRTSGLPTGRQAPGLPMSVTTELPSTSTFSVEEDLVFLKNLKSVLNTNNIEDPETALANRIIALAVEKSLKDIATNTTESARDGKAISGNFNNRIPITTQRLTTTSITSLTSTPKPSTTTLSTPSIEEDIKQFEKDAKFLQALLKATGQDPTKFNIPTIPNVNINVRNNPAISSYSGSHNLRVLSNLLASPSPSTVTTKENKISAESSRTTVPPPIPRPFGAKIAVKDNLNNSQDDKRLLKTLIKLQDARETSTQRGKITFSGQTSDEALNKLLRSKPGMMSSATQPTLSLSTEYGKSNDALLAALLKEQGFGPTTPSSRDEQLRLTALLNQVVVTPKAQRINTTPPPPPPPPVTQRRPVLDGLAWLWQQWRETAPGPGAPRPNRRPAAAPTVASSSSSNRANWFGSGPFVGNADDSGSGSAGNRVPLEPPAVVRPAEPGSGQLVSAAINVTRAFSQFLGAAMQGAVKTVQNVIRAGQRVASDVYVNGSG